jgi:cytochrome c biogenesis protein CcmG/thiol:disulfide interchange protein DsbE
MNARHWSLAALWLLAAGALVAYGWSNLRPSAAALARAAEIAEKRAAELAGESFPAGLTLPMLTPFRDGWGDRLEFDTYRGRRPIVVNVWASWCPPCAREAPLLEAAWQRFSEQAQFVGVNYRDQRADALAFLQEYELTFPNGEDPAGTTTDPLRIFGLPTTFFVDASGRVVGQQIGELDEGTLTRLVDRAIRGSRSRDAAP